MGVYLPEDPSANGGMIFWDVYDVFEGMHDCIGIYMSAHLLDVSTSDLYK